MRKGERSQTNQIEGIYPLTPLQEGMLFHKIVEGNSSDYVIQQVYDVNKALVDEYVVQALNLLMERHNVLRTVIMHQKLSSPQQVVLKNRAMEYERITLDLPHSEAFEEKMADILREDLKRGFELSKDCLIRVKLISNTDGTYKMLWSYHHIIIDGWCIAILKNDFIRFYSALEGHKPLAFLKNVIRREKQAGAEYVDYIKWMSQYDKEKGLAYWEKLLEDYDQVAQIAPMYKLPHTEQEMIRHSHRVDSNVYQKLTGAAATSHVTLNAVLETAWGILLQSYNNTDDVVFGKVVSGRNIPIEGINDVVGLFVNTIPVRVRCEQNDSVKTLLERVMMQGIDSGHYDHSSLADIQQRSLCGSNLFKTLYAFENYYVADETEEAKKSIELEQSFVREQTNYDLTVSINTLNNQLNVNLLYNPNQYCEDEIKRILQHFEVILIQMAENMDYPVKSMELIASEEKNEILHVFNDTDTEYERDKSVMEVFQQQAAEHPDKLAVCYQDEKLTYAQLNVRANQVARQLQKLGTKADDFVAIVAKKGIEMLVGICGILKAGGAYVPLDANYPKSRIDYILNDCKPKALLYVDEKLDTEITQICLQDDIFTGQDIDCKEPVDPAIASGARNLAYLIYTSGTTGQPKGSQIEQRSILRLVRNTNFLAMDEKRVFLQTGSMAFDASTLEVWGALLNGGTIVLADEDVITDASRLKAVIEKNQVNTMWMTSSLYNQMIQMDREVFDGLDDLLIGGEKLSDDHVRMLKEANQKIRLTNGYGPTEGTTFTTTYEIPEGFDSIPIGKPIANTQVFIMNGDRLCGVGMPGELCIGGDGVARGYLNQPELTKEKFTDNPFQDGKIYHSGDLARWLPDGNVDYLGRMDEQVKIRGFRIELGEIESVIRMQDVVNDCAVVMQVDEMGDKAVSAYLVSDHQINLMELRESLKKILPGYMMPSYMMQIEEIPLTHNGKLNRRALPKIERTGSRSYEAPRTKQEETLCELFSSILNVEHVGIQDDFFELGGHSLRATRLTNRIEQAMGRKVALKDVFTYRTPAALSKRLEELEKEAEVAIPVKGGKDIYPMSSAQKQVFLTCQMDPDGILYNMPLAIRMDGIVDVSAIELALQQVVNRHEILRTIFCIENREPVQKVLATRKADFIYKEDAETSGEELMRAFVKPFDLQNDCLVRMELIKRASEYLLLFDMHHIVGDGMSMGIFLNEFIELYNGEKLPEEPRQYRDYSQWMADRNLEKQAAYWKSQFEGEVPVLEMPLDHPRSSEQGHDGNFISIQTNTDFMKSLENLSRKTGATEYMIFMAGLMVMLGKYSRQEDIVVGCPISGRTHRDTESMLGMFVNTLAMRGMPEKDKPFCDFLQEVKTTCLNGYEHQDYPLEELLDKIDVVRDLARNPLFDVVLVLQNNEETVYNFHDVKAEVSGIIRRIAKFDLTFHIEANGDGYCISLEYASALYEEDSARRMLAHYLYVLHQVMEHAEKKIGDIILCQEDEKKIILEQFNQPSMMTADGPDMVDYFEEQAAKHGDKVAVACGEETLTYDQLNARANVVAKKLRALGVGKDVPVGIIAERNMDTVVGLVGIIKAGGAYVPIDGSYPETRIQYILKDSECKALILTGELEPEAACTKIRIDEEQESENLEQIGARDALAYIIYTSGTTGQPKGSTIEQKSIIRLVKNANFLIMDESRVVLQTGSMAFDASTLEIWGALLNGGTLVIADQEVILNAQKLKKAIKKYQVDTMWMTSTLYNQMISEDHHLFDSLRDLLIGGEKLSPDHVRMLKNHESKVRLHNGYGPTENTTFTTTYEIPEHFEDIPIGKPISETQVYIMDGEKLCGIGVPGELCIAGAGLARGYLNLPELTAKKFTKNPYGKGLLYHSGDLARWNGDGTVQYLGRLDEQVKIRGFRIELGEIESSIRQLPNIKDCAVTIRVENNSKAVSAYYVTDVSVEGQKIREALAKTLPEYMIPTYLMQIDRIPVTTNGKLDKRKLPWIVAKSEAFYVAPANKQEELVCRLFAEILGLDRVGVDDGFFVLGGDSIKAIRIISGLRQEGYEISLKQVMGGRTPRNIAKLLIESIEKEAIQYEQGEVTGAVEKVPMLQYFANWNLVNESQFNQAMLIPVGEAAEEQVKKALQAVTEYHDMLRAVYQDGSLVIRPVQGETLYELVSCDYGVQTKEELEQICKEQQRSMDLANGPMVHGVYYHSSMAKEQQENFLLVIIHHLVVDGVSFSILAQDLQTACSQLITGQDIVLPKKTASYQQWADVLMKESKAKAQKDKEYWKQVTGQLEAVHYERGNEGQQEHDGKQSGNQKVTFVLDEALTTNLLENANVPYGTKPEELLVSGLARAVCETFHSSQAGIWMEGHGREELKEGFATDRTVGWFTTLYPIVLPCSETIDDCVITTKDTIRRVPSDGRSFGLLNENLPKEELVISFNYHGKVMDEYNPYDLPKGTMIAEENTLPWDISINGAVQNGKLLFTVFYNCAVFTETEVRELIHAYEESLEQIKETMQARKMVCKTVSDYSAKDLSREELAHMQEVLADAKITDIYGLTSLQEGMLLSAQVEEESQSYVIQMAYDVEDKIEEECLRNAFTLMIEKNPVLTTAIFHHNMNRPLQAITRGRNAEYEVVDYTQCEMSKAKGLAEELRKADMERGFNLEQDSLIRMKVIQFADESSQLLVSFHHIILDGWCMSMVINDLFAYYEQLHAGADYGSLRESARKEAEAKTPYQAYVAYLEEQDGTEARKYWDSQLEGYSNPAVILPEGKPETVDEQMRRYGITIREEITKALKKIMTEQELTCSTICETAWGILLQKYNGTQDAVFDKVTSGRNVPIPDAQEIVGLFINTVPARIQNEDNERVSSLLKKVKEADVNAEQYSTLNLADIKRRAGIENGQVGTLYAFENYYVREDSAAESEHVLKAVASFAREQTEYDLTVSINQLNDQLNVNLLYDPNQYTDAEVERILHHYEMVLAQIAKDSECLVDSIEVITDRERNCILNEFNATQTEYERDKSVMEVFEEQVRNYPDKAAVRYQDKALTYVQLNAAANQVAYRLLDLGVKADDFVAIVAEKSIEMLIGICGILKAGGAYVPLDANYPKSRIDYMLRDCNPKAVLYANEKLDTEIEQIDLREIRIPSLNGAEGKNSNPDIGSDPRDLAYLIYTSGTTGQPKGSQIEQRSILRLVRNTNFLAMDAKRVFLQTGSMAFDASTLEVWGALLNGGTIVLADEDVITDASKLKDVIKKNDVNTMWMTSSLYNQMIQMDLEVFSELDDLLIGGEKLSDDHVRMLKESGQKVNLINGYGPTEGTTFTTTYEIPENFDSIPIGKPIANTQVYIMNRNCLCGIGVPGELCIGGDGVARGYLNQPELTAKKFTDNPYGEGKLYHSGDLARWLPDGTVDYLGRIDEQVKIRGFRIELGEIESAIRLKDIVKDCAVIVQTDESGDKAVCAYLVSEETIDMQTLRQELKEVLPNYMMPSYMMQIEKIPLTNNGKLDRRALPKIEGKGSQAYQAPRTRQEEMLCELFEEILNVEHVGIQDDFFELGGHSLRATRLVNRMEQVMGQKITLKEMFKYRTVSELAERLSQMKKEAEQAIPDAGIREYYPMSSAQKQVFLTCQMDPEGILYNMPQAIHMEGEVNVSALEHALQAMVDLHEILRTVFCLHNGEAVQKVLADRKAQFVYTEGQENRSDEELMEAFVKPFDLQNDCLVRMELIKRKTGYMLLFDMHHIVGDGMSMGIFLKEFIDIYNGKTYETIPRQYRDYSEWMSMRNFDVQAAYWKSQFQEEIPILEMPLDHPRTSEQGHDGNVVSIKVNKKFMSSLEKLAKETGTTEYMIFMAGLMVMLGRYSRQEDVVVGCPISGRTHRDTEKMLGMFVNTLAIRAMPEHDKSFATFLGEVKTTCLNGYEHQDYPLEELLNEIDVVRDLARNPLFDVVLVLQNNEETVYNFHDVKAKASGIKRRIAKFDLTFHIEAEGDGYCIALEYASALYEEKSARKLLDHYVLVLEQVMENPEQQIEQIGICSIEEQNIILEQFNQPSTMDLDGPNMTAYFEEQVMKNGSHVAVACGGETLTYEQLNARANAVAEQLRAFGIKNDVPVAIMAERNLNTVVGLLGIIKAGGAYVPIDSNYPEARIQYILQDSQCKALILTGEMEPEAECAKLRVDGAVKQENPENISRRSDLAYIIYTSGTTGQPKGSTIEQKSIIRLVKNANFLTMDESRVVLQTGSMAFDASTLEIWGPLLNGGTLVVGEKEVILDVQQLKAAIEKYQVDTMWMTSTLFNQMITDDEHLFDNLRDLLIGGEKLSPDHVHMLKNHESRVRLHNGYGPTENTTFTTTYEIPADFDDIPIGKPISETQVYIMDGDKLCGIGVPGELCIAGAGLARGYLNLPELTAQKFTKNPFGEGMLYHSGDLARWNSDGTVRYLGRLDEQVKIRGFRIELGEIESSIRQLEDIKDCAVTIREDQGSKAVSAYYVADKKVEGQAIREALSEFLPEYMIPSYLMQIDRIPITNNGKLDKRKLPWIEAMSENSYVAPKNQEEETVCHLYEEILLVDRVGVEDGFFSLGGDSIKAIRIISMLRQEGYEISLKQVMEGRTPKNIAKMLTRKEETHYEQGEITGEVVSVPVLTSFASWNLQKEAHFNQSMLIFVGEASEAQVREALKALVKHHDMLRAVYQNGKLVIRSMEEAKSSEKLYQMEVCDYGIQTQEEMYRICEEQQASMNLLHGPMVHAVYFQNGKNVCDACTDKEAKQKENFVLLIVHHLVVDGVSFSILAQDLKTACHQLEEGKEIMLPKKTASYQQWASVLTGACKEDAHKDKPYWLKMIKQLESVRYDKIKKSETMETCNQTICFSLEEGLTAKLLKSANRSYGTKPEELLISGFIKAVCQTFHSKKTGIWMEGHGREELQEGLATDRTVGWFTTLYPLVFETGENLEDCIINTKDTMRRVPSHGRSFGLLNESRIAEQLVLGFNYHGKVADEYNPHHLPVGEMIARENKLPWDISMNGVLQNGKLVYTVIYNQTLLSENQINAFIEQYKKVLQEISRHCCTATQIMKTVSDFTAHDLNREELVQIEKALGEADVTDIYGLTSMQEGMLLSCQVQEDTQNYVIQAVYELQGQVDANYLKEAFSLMIEKHPVLTTAIFYNNMPRPLQVTSTGRPLEFTEADYTAFSLDEAMQMAEELRQKDLEQGFDFEQDMLIRMHFIRLAEGKSQMLLSFHHIILDGWCMSLILGDLFSYYEKRNQGESYDKLVEEARAVSWATTPYSRYVQYLEQAKTSEAYEYWDRQLEAYENESSIPADEPAEASKEQMKRYSIVIKPEITEGIKHLMSQQEVTASTFCETAWGLLLQRYNKTDDIIFDKVTSGRNVPLKDVQEIVGLFVNTVPSRIMSSDEVTIQELLAQVKEADNDSEQYATVSLADIKKRAGIENGQVGSLYAFENYYVKENVTGQSEYALKAQPVYAREQTEYPLTLSMNMSGNQLHAELLYNPNEYADTQIKRILVHFEQILMQMAQNPKQKVSALTLVTEEEKNRILTEFNETDKVYKDYENSFSRLLEKQAERIPHKIALISPERQVTYEEFNKQVTDLATVLQERGVKPGDYVAVIAERSIEMMIAIYGAIRAGATYVPIDPLYPEERIEYILKDCKPAMVLVYHAECKQGYQVLDLTDKESMKTANAFQLVEYDMDRILYAIYTSGTTGEPKGVMNYQRGLLNIMYSLQSRYPLGENDTILQKTSYCFDVSASEIFWFAVAGAALVLPEPGAEKDPERISELIEQYSITVVNFVPSMLQLFISTAQDNPKIAKKLAGLRYVIAAGEALGEDSVTQLYNLLTGINDNLLIVNAYGPTEASIYATYYDCIRGAKKVTIGKPVDNGKVYILNQDALAGIGVPGELCIAGAGVAKGYVNLPDMTKEKFVKNPYGTGRLYRTGDLARWLPDGNIVYMGRMDEQVKIRGFRIELKEIESVLRDQKDVKDCAVIAHTDETGDKSIHAYVVSSKQLDLAKVREQLKEKLPEYMLPSYMMQIDEIPLTGNGKLNRKALPKDKGRMKTGEHYQVPQGKQETVICQIFEEILGIDKVGRNDDFFLLGGHSLRANRLANRIEQELGVKVGLKDIFKERTPKELAKIVEELTETIASEEQEDLQHIPTAKVKEFYPMSSVQKQVYLASQLDKEGILYNMPQVIRLEGNVVKERLEEAFAQLVRNHEILRTQFLMQEGALVQKVLEDRTAPFTFVEDKEDREEIELMHQFVQPFDLENDPLIRMELVKQTESYLLLLDIHHIIGDGMSVGNFMREFIALYNGETVTPPERQYKDYSEWIATKDMEGQKQYWLSHLEGELPVLEMPLDYPRQSEQSHEGQTVHMTVDEELAQDIRAFTAKEDCTEFMFYLATLQVLLGQYSRQEDIIVGSPFSGRTHEDTESMLGMFVNTLPLRGKPEKKKTFSKFLGEIKEVCLQAYDNQEFTLEEIVEEVVTDRDLSRNPLFDVMLVVQNNEAVQANFNDLKVIRAESEIRVSKFDLTFYVYYNTGEIALGLEYNSDLYKKDSAELFLEHFITVLRQVALNPECCIGDIRSASPKEEQLICTEFNQPVNPLSYKTLNTLLKELVQRPEMADRIALISQEHTVTYHQFYERANQIADKLRKLGIQRGDRVALVAERSTELVCAIFGIFLSGGVYVPVGNDAPEERRNQILEDSDVKAVVSCYAAVETALPKLTLEELKPELVDEVVNVNCPEDLAYIIYTSGSSGKPKGVMISHKAAESLVDYLRYDLDIEASDKIMMFANYVFDGSIWEMFMAVYNGVPLVIPTDDMVHDPELMKDFVEKMGVTISYFPPAYYLQSQIVLSKFVVTAGSSSSHDVVQKAIQNSDYINSYGPTETTVCATNWFVRKGDSVPDTIAIGKPIRNKQVYIMEENQLCGIKVPGEICIAGEGLAEGYLNSKELTAKAFVQNPFGEGKMYRTGDMGRWLPDGNIEYLGRIDEQVKIRGYRIELNEIKNVILQIDGVTVCEVLYKENQYHEKSLYGFYVSNQTIGVNTVKECLRKQLPEYMIPSYLIQVNEIPVNSSGKTDKKALLAYTDEALSRREILLPENEKERAVCDAFTKILDIAEIGTDESFFEMGGDSIKAIRIISLLREAGYEVSLKEIMRGRTPRTIANSLTKVKGFEYNQGEVTGQVPATPMLKEYERWKLANPEHFNQSIVIDAGNCTEQQARQALEAIVHQHDMLHAVYKNGSLQVLSTKENAGFELGCIVLDGSQDVTVKTRQIADEVQTSMDLEHGPLVKAVLYEGLGTNYLFLCIHHLIVDAVSFRIIIEDLNEALTALREGRKIVLPKKTASFIEWSQYLNRYGEQQAGTSVESYWTKVKEQVSDYGIVYDMEESKVHAEHSMKELHFTIDEEVTTLLTHEALKAFHTEVEDMLLSALGLATGALTGQEKLAVCMEGHGRETLEEKINIDRTVGWFTASYYAILDCCQDIPSSITVNKDILHSIPDGGLGCGFFGENAAADVYFNYFGEFKEAKELPIATGENIGSSNRLPGNISFNGSIVNGELHFTIAYDSGLYKESTIQKLQKLFIDSVSAIVRYCAEQKDSKKTLTDMRAKEITSNDLDIINLLFQ